MTRKHFNAILRAVKVTPSELKKILQKYENLKELKG
jgi:hypothetical protein